MPIQATPDSVSPIQTPLPRIRNSAAISSAGDGEIAHLTRCAGLRPASCADAPPAQLEHQFVDEGDEQDHGCPTAIASCGIHSGVASLAVEMSLNRCDCQASRTL